MNKNFLRTFAKIDVYRAHEENAPIIKTLEPDTYINFTREKRRNGINWIEILLEGDEPAYIKKNKADYIICVKASLSDKTAKGFNYQFLNGETDFHKAFNGENPFQETEAYDAKAELSRLEDDDDAKQQSFNLSYDTAKVQVERISLTKDEEFYVTRDEYTNGGISFIEIDNLNGKKGLFMDTLSYSEAGDKWMGPLTIVLTILATIGVIAFGLSLGWFVFGKIIILIGLVIAVVCVIVINIIVMILKGIFNAIRKRF